MFYCVQAYRLKVPFKSNPVLLFPSHFFEEVISNPDEIEKLQNEVVSLHGYIEGVKHSRYIVQADALSRNEQTNAQANERINPISSSVRKLEDKYRDCIKGYLIAGKAGDDTKDETEAEENVKDRKALLENKIALCHRMIEGERASFQTDNGDSFLSFTMNRQNEFSNFLITGVMVPMLMEAISNDVSSISEFVNLVMTNPVLKLTTYGFFILIAYRFWKYFRNKYSMLKSANQVILYNKAEELLTAFECALNDID